MDATGRDGMVLSFYTGTPENCGKGISLPIPHFILLFILCKFRLRKVAFA